VGGRIVSVGSEVKGEMTERFWELESVHEIDQSPRGFDQSREYQRAGKQEEERWMGLMDSLGGSEVKGEMTAKLRG